LLLIQSGESLIVPTLYEVLLSQSAGEISDHELGCIVLKCWLENANDQISIETVAGQLCNKMRDLVNERLQVVAALASCLARSSQAIRCLFVERLVHVVHGPNLLNLTHGYLMDEASTVLLALSDFQHETVDQLVRMVVQAAGETLTFLSNGLVGSICTLLQNDSLPESQHALIVGALLPWIPDIARNRRDALGYQVSWDGSDIEIRHAI
jgi:hypothetical protein